MPYFLTLNEPCLWKIDVEDFERQLELSWQGVEITNLSLPRRTMQLSWWFVAGDDRPLADLHPDGQTISIDGSEPAIAIFALWYRKIVPFDCRLYLYHDSWGEDEVEIILDMTEEEIQDRINSIG